MWFTSSLRGATIWRVRGILWLIPDIAPLDSSAECWPAQVGANAVPRKNLEFLFLNIGHFLDHFFVLIFATASLRLTIEWNMSYSELIPYGTLGFVAFGLGAIPAGWLADKWSREGMMAVFFIGIGTCSILTSLASTPVQISICLTAIGLFGAIY